MWRYRGGWTTQTAAPCRDGRQAAQGTPWTRSGRSAVKRQVLLSLYRQLFGALREKTRSSNWCFDRHAPWPKVNFSLHCTVNCMVHFMEKTILRNWCFDRHAPWPKVNSSFHYTVDCMVHFREKTRSSNWCFDRRAPWPKVNFSCHYTVIYTLYLRGKTRSGNYFFDRRSVTRDEINEAMDVLTFSNVLPTTQPPPGGGGREMKEPGNEVANNSVCARFGFF